MPTDPDPLRTLFDAHYQPLVRTATALLGDRAEAEEAVQEAFVRVDGRLATIPAEGHLPYLRRAVLNQARSDLRRRRAAKRQSVPQRVTADGPEDAAVHADEQRRVLAALDGLPTRQRECLVLRFYAELSDAEIAAALDISPNSVKTHVRRGVDALRAMELSR